MKLQITLTDQEEKLLGEKAKVLGYDVTKYVKFLLAREALDRNVLGIPMSQALEEKVKRAIKDDDKKKTKVWDLSQYDNQSN